MLQGLYGRQACRLRDLGWEYDRMVERLLAIRRGGRIFFTINIDYLKHGGRIGKVMGIAGSALKIKPLITLKEGEIFASGIARSREKSMQKVIEMLKAYLDERTAKPGEYSFAKSAMAMIMRKPVIFVKMLKEIVRAPGIDEVEFTRSAQRSAFIPDRIRSAWGLSNARTYRKRRADRSRR